MLPSTKGSIKREEHSRPRTFYTEGIYNTIHSSYSETTVTFSALLHTYIHHYYDDDDHNFYIGTTILVSSYYYDAIIGSPVFVDYDVTDDDYNHDDDNSIRSYLTANAE
jgi:hypothetical protein